MPCHVHICHKSTSQWVHASSNCSDASSGLGLGSLWSVATAVTTAVKQTADEVVKSVQQTDWKSELTAFTLEVEAEAHKAVEVVQHLPQHIPQAPKVRPELVDDHNCLYLLHAKYLPKRSKPTNINTAMLA